MKKFLIAGLIVCSLVASQAATLTTNLAPAAAANCFKLLLTNKLVTDISVTIPTAAAAGTVNFYDGPTATNAVTLAEWVTVSGSTTSVTNTYIAPSGVTNVTTNLVYTLAFTTNAAASVALPTITSVSLPAGETVHLSDQRLQFARSIVINATTNAFVTITYQPLK